MQLNLFTKQKETHRLREQTYGFLGEGWGERIVREFGMDMYTLPYLKWITTGTYYIAQGTLLNVIWQPGWKGSLGENEYMYMYGWVTSLFTWNCHNTILSAISSVQFSRSVVSNSLRSHELQHARPPGPLPTPGVHPNSCPLSQWCHPTIASSVVPFSSCPQSLPAPQYKVKSF